MCGMKRLVGAVAVIGMLALSGCVPEQVIPTLPPTPTDGPLFASEEEALAAATAAYEVYHAVASLIVQEGGAEPERIAPYVTEGRLSEEIESSKFYSDNGFRADGAARVTHTRLQQWVEAAGVAEIVMYVCLDVSDARVLDASGRDVTPSSRVDVVALEVVMEGSSTETLIVAGSQRWPDVSFC